MTIKSKFQTNVYKTYKDMCKHIHKEPISKKDVISEIDFGALKLKSYRQQGHKEPYICLRLDDDFVLYLEINQDRLVANVWDNEQCKFLIGGGNGITRDNNNGRSSST